MHQEDLGPPPFTDIKRQLKAAVKDALSTGEGRQLGPAPVLSFSGGKAHAQLDFERDRAPAPLELLRMMKGFYPSIGELEFSAAEMRWTGVVRDTRLLFGIEPHEERKLETQVTLDFGTLRLDGVPMGAVRFTKDQSFHAEDVECILATWKFLAREQAAPPSAAAQLEELGASVHTPDSAWDFTRIGGYASEKEALTDTVILPLRSPEMFRQVNALTRVRPLGNVPRAVLLEGPPGTGKTTLARVVASEAQRALVVVPVESLMSKWYGESETRLSDIFAAAGELAGGCVLFLDELDSLVGTREHELHEATRRILSVLLRSLQGIERVEGVVVLGATNRAQDLDPALRSRFDRIIPVRLPHADERVKILRLYARQLTTEELAQLSEATDGLAGRDLEDLCGDAERVWARMLVNESKPASAPPLDIYLRAVRTRARNAPTPPLPLRGRGPG